MKIYSFVKVVLTSICMCFFLAPLSADFPKRNDKAVKLNIQLKGSLQNPAVSPDSKSLLFTRWHKGYNRGSADLFIFNLKSSLLTSLVANGDCNCNLPGSSWNSKIKKIIFSSERETHDEIYMISPDGSGEVQLTERKKEMSYEPTFSPDGKWVVFESHPVDVEEHGVITKCRVSGTKKYIPLTSLDEDCRQPNWSPDGKHILYQKQINDQWDIWIMDEDGSNHKKVTQGEGSKTDATFSPDGEWIVYSSDGNGELPLANIYATNLKSGKNVRITHYRGYDGAPSWSADGKYIFFESSAKDPDNSKGTQLYMIEVPAVIKKTLRKK